MESVRWRRMSARRETDLNTALLSGIAPVDALRPDLASLINTTLDVREDAEACLRAAIRRAMAEGVSIEDLADLTGLRRSTITRWRRS